MIMRIVKIILTISLFICNAEVSAQEEKKFDSLLIGANQGNVDDQITLGNMYALGNSMPIDADKAIYWYEKAAKQGSTFAMSNIIYVLNPVTNPNNRETAAHWATMGANKGDSNLQFQLGYFHEHGFGVSLNLRMASQWYMKSAQQNDINAQNNLGYQYLHGKGVPRNLILGYAWLSIAISGGKESASRTLQQLENIMTADEIAEAQKISARWKPGHPLEQL